MTDKEKLEKLVAYLMRRMYAHNQKADIGSTGVIFDEKIENAKYEECRDTLNFIDSMQKDSKECMYSKDNYTDEDRKALCDGCEEECRFNKKEESVSDSFEAKVKNLWKEINTWHNYSIVDSYNQFYGLCLDIAEWQKEQLMEKAVEGTLLGGHLIRQEGITHPLHSGDKVKVIVIKED